MSDTAKIGTLSGEPVAEHLEIASAVCQRVRTPELSKGLAIWKLFHDPLQAENRHSRLPLHSRVPAFPVFPVIPAKAGIQWSKR